MVIEGENKQRNIKQLAGLYNLLLNLFWSALSFVPLCIFCYERVENSFLFLFIGLSLLPALLSHSTIDKLQLAKSTKTYKKLGVSLIQHVSQSGVFINYLIRRQYPSHKVVRRERRSIEALLKQTYFFEKFHITGLVFFCLNSIYALGKGLVGWALFLTSINLVYNVYPILLQQYIRLKLAGYNKKSEIRTSAANQG